MKIKYYAEISDWMGCTEEEVSIAIGVEPEIPVRRIMSVLAVRHGEAFRRKIFDPASGILQDDIFILLNGRHLARLNGLDSMAENNDTLAVIPVTEAG